MAENQNDAPAQAAAAVATAPAAPAPKAKPKLEKVRVCLIGAGSVNYNGVFMKKGDVQELDAVRAEEFLKTRLFAKL